jgi:hypothetical protein
VRPSALIERETLEQRRREEQALLQSTLRNRETPEEQLRRQLDAQRKTDIRKRETIERLESSLSTHNITWENSNVEQHYIGLKNEICHECQSINFKDRKPNDGNSAPVVIKAK